MTTNPTTSNGQPADPYVELMRLLFLGCRDAGNYPHAVIGVLATYLDDIQQEHHYCCSREGCEVHDALRQARAALEAYYLIETAGTTDAGTGGRQ